LYGDIIAIVIFGFGWFRIRRRKPICGGNTVHFIAYFLELVLRNARGNGQSYDSSSRRTHDALDCYSLFPSVLPLFIDICGFLFSNGFIGTNVSQSFCSSALESQMKMFVESDFIPLEFRLLVRVSNFIPTFDWPNLFIILEPSKALQVVIFWITLAYFFLAYYFWLCITYFNSRSKKLSFVRYLEGNFEYFHICILWYSIVKQLSVCVNDIFFFECHCDIELKRFLYTFGVVEARKKHIFFRISISVLALAKSSFWRKILCKFPVKEKFFNEKFIGFRLSFGLWGRNFCFKLSLKKPLNYKNFKIMDIAHYLENGVFEVSILLEIL